MRKPPRPSREQLLLRIRRAFFNTLHDLLWDWVLFSLASIFYVLTVIYAWHPELVSRYAWIGGSSARAILILSILSGIGNPLLAMTIDNSLDIVINSLAARGTGHYLIDNQILQTSTGIKFLLAITFGKHVTRKRSRAWSIIKFCVWLLSQHFQSLSSVCTFVAPLPQLLC
jgi:hypothetical protein